MNRKLVFAAAGAAVVVALWLLWPAKAPVNLDSRGTNVIAFGDSLTSGAGASAGEDYPSRLSALLGVDIVNAGVSGDTTAGALARLDEDVLAHDPRIVIVGLGGNDFMRGTSIGETEANLRNIVRRIQAAGAMVVILGFRFPSLAGNYEEMYERVAEEEGCLLVEDALDGILGNPALKSDQIHPNGRGYLLIAERVARPTRKLIARADAAR